MSLFQSSQSPPPAAPPTPYQIIGGTATVRRIVERIYKWISLDDELWLRYFAEVNAREQMPNLKAHMTEQLCQILGGPREYTLRELGEAHQPLNITSAHYDRVGDYVLAALYVEHTPGPIITAVQDVLAKTKPVIVATGRNGG